MLKSVMIVSLLSLAAPAIAQERTTAAQAPRKAKKPHHVVRAPKPAQTTATGTTTPQPTKPTGTVPQGAPGTQDPTLPGSPPN